MKKLGVFTGVLYSDLFDENKTKCYTASVNNIRKVIPDADFYLLLNGEYKDYKNLYNLVPDVHYIETNVKSLFTSRMYAFRNYDYDKYYFIDYDDYTEFSNKIVSIVTSDYDFITFGNRIYDIDEGKLTIIRTKEVRALSKDYIVDNLLFRSPVIYSADFMFSNDLAKSIVTAWDNHWSGEEFNYSEDTMMNILGMIYCNSYLMSDEIVTLYIRRSSNSMFREGDLYDKVTKVLQVIKKADELIRGTLPSEIIDKYLNFILAKKLEYPVKDVINNTQIIDYKSQVYSEDVFSNNTDLEYLHYLMEI